LSRKDILISDPSVKEMNATQWLFELESLYNREETKYKEYTAIGDLVRKSFIHMLGLNLFPIEEQVGVDAMGDPIVRYRKPEDHEILPLTMYVGREEMIKEVLERNEALYHQDEYEAAEEAGEVKHMTPEELDAFMQDEDDLVFDDPEEMRKYNIWNSEGTKRALHSLVEIRDKYPDEDPANELIDDNVPARKPSKPKIYVDED